MPFKDTFRRERSLVYQSALKRRLAQQAARASEASSVSQVNAVSPVVQGDEEKREEAEKREENVGVSPRERDVEKDGSRVQIDGEAATEALKEVKLSLSDVNPVKPIVHVVRRLNNLAMFFASGALHIVACQESLAVPDDFGQRWSFHARIPSRIRARGRFQSSTLR